MTTMETAYTHQELGIWHPKPQLLLSWTESTGWEVDVTEEYHKQAASPRRQKGRVQLGCWWAPEG